MKSSLCTVGCVWLFPARVIFLFMIGLTPASSTPHENVYTAAFIVDSHNVPRRTDEDRMQICHPEPRCHFGRGFRVQGQSVPVCLCSCYHRGMWDLHLKQLLPRPDPISHCKGALLLSHLCHTGSLRLLELYIMCFRVCVKGMRGEMLRGV